MARHTQASEQQGSKPWQAVGEAADQLQMHVGSSLDLKQQHPLWCSR